MATLRTIVDRVLTNLGHVSGPSVQLYSEDIVAERINIVFDTLIEAAWWNDLLDWDTYTLTAQGEPSESSVSTDITVTRDILTIFYKDDPLPLTTFDTIANPQRYAKSGHPRYWEPNATTKRFRVLPYGYAGDQVHVRHRVRPQRPFGADDVVPLDETLLVLMATADYLTSDGTNPADADKYRILGNDHLKTLMIAETGREVILPWRAHT